MAQLDFYLSTEDKIDLMSFIFSEGGYIVPDINYEKPTYNLVKDLEGYSPFVEQNILFFIVHDSYLREPLSVRSISKDGKELFYIPQRNDGPTIDFYSSGRIEKGGEDFIGSGNISHYSTYFSSSQNINVDVPEQLKQFYKKVSSHIKKNSFAIKFSE